MLVYSTSTADIGPYDPLGYTATPYDLEPMPEHVGCAHTIGYCADADWD